MQPTFDRLKKSFMSQKTKPLKWRLETLRDFIIGLRSMEKELCEAMRKDLGRDMFINYFMEISFMEASLVHEI